MKFRFHCLGVPHTVTHHDYVACAYTQKVLKFCKMMHSRGHHLIHYGHEDSEVDADEHVTVTTNADLKKAYGNYNWRENFFKYDIGDHVYKTFYKNAIKEINKRKEEYDFILAFWGHGVRPVCDEHEDCIIVEPGIGYPEGHFARWKIFESYSLLHAYGGMEKVTHCNPNWYDVVIPNYFDLDDFTYNEKKEDYFLYLGRVYEGKGVHIAIAAAREIGVKLIIAGQKENKCVLPDGVEYIGYADLKTRKELMSKAKGSFLPTLYSEPFGGVQIENLLSGTPTITTDWGAFTENNLHGITGYRCRTMGDFIESANLINAGMISPQACRDWGDNFSLDRIAPMYEKYFRDVMNVYTGKGWYEPLDNPSRLGVMAKEYPQESHLYK